MPRFLTPGRVALGLVLLGGGPAAANDGPLSRLLHHKCDKPGCGETERVTIPGRQVEIVTERPRVTVTEAAPAREFVTRHVRSHRVVESAPVSVGTVYLPVALPAVTAMPLAAAPGCREVRDVRDGVGDGDPFADLHQAEVAAHRAELARLRVQATVEAQQRFLARMNANVQGRGPVAPDPSAAEITRKIEELAGQVGKLNTRVETVEKILVFHDNLLKDKVLGMPTPVKEKAPEVVPPAIKVETVMPPAVKSEGPKNPPMIPPLPPGQ